MSKQSYIFELSASSFSASAVQNSFQLPVLVEFMAVWSGPCVLMADRLAALADEFAGDFVFAKVDIDEQQALREQYQVENVPTLVVLRNGEEVRREVGELPDPELRALLREFGVFRASDEQREQARQLHMAGDTHGAVMLLTQAIKADPSNTRIALDMVQIFVDMGELTQAQALFDRLPEAERTADTGKSLLAQIKFASLAAQTDSLDRLQAHVEANPHDSGARFDLAIRQVAGHAPDEAMDQLFQIQQADPGFRDGAAREMISLLSNMLAASDPEAASAYRRRLANLLNSA